VSVLDHIRAMMRKMTEPQPPPEPFKLFVATSHFEKGEEWVRRHYGVGADIEIIESVPIAYAGDAIRPPRRYPSALEAYERARKHGIGPDYGFSSYEAGGIVYDNPFFRRR